MRNRKVWGALTASLCVAVLGLSACGSDGGTSQSDTSAPPSNSPGSSEDAPDTSEAPDASDAVDITLGLVGVPPTFYETIATIAKDEGFFSKRGLNVELKPFPGSGDIGRAVVSGQIVAGFMGSDPAIGLRATGSDVVGIYGMPVNDLVLVTADSSVTDCASIKGKTVGVDPVAAPKSTALFPLLATCGLTPDDVEAVHIGGNAQADALLSGQVGSAVLHLDDVANIEAQGKEVRTVVSLTEATPLAHLGMLVALKDSVQANRDQYVALVGGLIEAADYIYDPANADKVAAAAAKTTNADAKVAAGALQGLIDIEFWPKGNDGMPQDRVEYEIQSQVKAEAVTADTAPTFDELVDGSIYADAVKAG